MRLIEIEQNVNLAGNEKKMLNLSIAPYNKCEVKGIYVEGNDNDHFDLNIYDKEVTGFLLYSTKDVVELYDILSMPYSDKDKTNALHLEIKNNMVTATAFRIRIMATALD